MPSRLPTNSLGAIDTLGSADQIAPGKPERIKLYSPQGPTSLQSSATSSNSWQAATWRSLFSALIPLDFQKLKKPQSMNTLNAAIFALMATAMLAAVWHLVKAAYLFDEPEDRHDWHH